MMAMYDTEKCDSSFGNGLVDAWRETGTECCVGGTGGAAAGSSSSIRCHFMKQVNYEPLPTGATYVFIYFFHWAGIPPDKAGRMRPAFCRLGNR